ncbi:MAG: hypothetical protein LBB48_03130 [Treponema sp.]|jgi:hypothetical protein|nr:hypothetical protein [Treponema sp.]
MGVFKEEITLETPLAGGLQIVDISRKKRFEPCRFRQCLIPEHGPWVSTGVSGKRRGLLLRKLRNGRRKNAVEKARYRTSRRSGSRRKRHTPRRAAS